MASNIITAVVSIKGYRPLFWHAFGPDSIPLEVQEKTGKAGNDPQEWRKTVLVNKQGQLFVLPPYAFATICNGAKYTKKGSRGSIQSDVNSTLEVMDSIILVDRWMPSFPNGHECDVKKLETPAINAYDDPIYIDVRGAINPTTKARNIRYRVAASPGWNMKFTIGWDKTIVSRSQMESAINDAGKLVGIGNGRKIGMGRFELESFDVQE